MCLFSDIKKCDIPLGMWLSVAFAFMIVETVLMEMRERLQSSDYWGERRSQAKCITFIAVFVKELAEYSW